MSRDQPRGNRPGSKNVAKNRQIQSPMDPAPMAENPASPADKADSLRKEAAERASRAVQPDRPRE